MYNLNLPESTIINKTIEKDKFFLHAITTPVLRNIYDEQIDKVI